MEVKKNYLEKKVCKNTSLIWHFNTLLINSNTSLIWQKQRLPSCLAPPYLRYWLWYRRGPIRKWIFEGFIRLWFSSESVKPTRIWGCFLLRERDYTSDSAESSSLSAHSLAGRRGSLNPVISMVARKWRVWADACGYETSGVWVR